MKGEDSSPAGDLKYKSSAEEVGGKTIDKTCHPGSGLDSSTKTDSSSGAKDSNPEEAATPDSGSTWADRDGTSAVCLELRVRGILQQKPLTFLVTYH